MATYNWSVPTGKEILGSTKIKEADNKIKDTIDDLSDFVNGVGVHANQGLTYDLVDRLTAQTISGTKTFAAINATSISATSISATSISGELTGNSSTSTALETERTIALSGDITGSATFDGTANATISTTLVAETFPSGGIIMWSGTIATIPSGWYLCDGLNGTPNLTNKFIVGAGDTYAPETTGGYSDSVVIGHSHTFSGTTSVDGFHTHPRKNGYHRNNDYYDASTAYGNNGGFTANTSDLGAGDHTHTFSGTTNYVGSDGTDRNLPPYFALAYIMKG